MKHLSLSERDQIEILLHKGFSIREIAKVLWRHHSSIDSEITKNKVNKRYNAQKANHKAYVRRLFCKKEIKRIRSHWELEQFVRDKIKQDRSPDEISHARNASHEVHVSTPTVYKYIYSRFGYWLTDHLYTKRPKPKRRRLRTKKVIIKYKTMIDARPKIIGTKREFGHREADLIMGKQWTKACLLVLIEMQTRFKLTYLLPDKWAIYVEKILHDCIKKYSIKSITFDNWTEFANHHKLGIPTYFCHAHSPREKPQVERWNRNIRRYYPKWFDFRKTTQEEIDIVLRKLNIRPMKCLHYKSPDQLFHSLLISQVAVLTL